MKAKLILMQILFTFIMLLSSIKPSLSEAIPSKENEENISFKFLAEQKEKEEANSAVNNGNQVSIISFLSIINPLLDIDEKIFENTQELMKGFFIGFPLLKNATENNSCIENKEFTDEALKIINTVAIIDFDSPDAKKAMYALFDEILNNKEIFRKEIKQCLTLQENMKPVFHLLIQAMEKKGYYDRFVLNLMGSLKKISPMVDAIRQANDAGNYKEVGRILGEMTKLVFFWDL